MSDSGGIYTSVPLLEALVNEDTWKSINPISRELQEVIVNYEYPPVEFNLSPIPPEISIGSIGVIVFPDNTTQQIIVSSIEEDLVKAVLLDSEKWIENPVFKLEI